MYTKLAFFGKTKLCNCRVICQYLQTQKAYRLQVKDINHTVIKIQHCFMFNVHIQSCASCLLRNGFPKKLTCFQQACLCFDNYNPSSTYYILTRQKKLTYCLINKIQNVRGIILFLLLLSFFFMRTMRLLNNNRVPLVKARMKLYNK